MRSLTPVDAIRHLFASPYSPACNGAVERLNQTLIGIIRSLVDDVADWDKVLAKSVIMYNNTYHSAIKSSPADFLMTNPYDSNHNIPMRTEESVNWREGHPNFKSFEVGQEVLKQIERVGNRASYKLMPKYDGPYTIKKVFSNGLSYEIGMEGCGSLKSHHKKLRVFYRLPETMKRFIPMENTCEELTEEVPDLQCNILTESSDNVSEFSFSGFNEHDSSHDEEYKEDSCYDKDKVDGVLNEPEVIERNRNLVELSQLPCSEAVVEEEEEDVESTPEDNITLGEYEDNIVDEKEGHLQSTPINEGRAVTSYFREFMEDEYMLEQTIYYQAEVLELVRDDWSFIEDKLHNIDSFLE